MARVDVVFAMLYRINADHAYYRLFKDYSIIFTGDKETFPSPFTLVVSLELIGQ